jgi:raffinose/stachyose/melibiose transport system permease protein
MRTSNLARTYSRWFLAPALAIFSIFFVLPAALGLWLSFTNASTLSDRQDFIGLDNFRLLQDNADVFLGTLRNQVIYAVLVTIGKTVIGVALAFLLNRAFRGRDVVRAIVYMPIMLSTIVVGILFTFLLAQDGLLNDFLGAIGLTGLTQDWLGSFDVALYAVAGVDVWMGVGWTVVIVLAAIQAIPAEIIEAGQIDGANAWQLTTRIKIPSIMHAISLAGMLTFVTGLKAFEIIYATTGGGPGHATEVMTIFVQQALGTTNLGYASAAAFVQFALIAAIAAVINAFIRRTGADQA